MSYEQKPGKGSVFKNEKKDKDSAPDYRGDAVCPCCEAQLWVSQWVNKPEGKKPYLSISLQRKEPKQDAPASKPAPAKADDFDDSDIPF